VRIQVGVPGMSGYGAGRGGQAVQGLHAGPVFEPAVAMRRQLKVLEASRKELGEEVELLHDMHERYPPNLAVQFAKEAERLRLFFLEDPLSPEDIAYFRQIRQNCATPIAMGELFNSPHEWTPLVAERLIDFIRMHVSQGGGLTPMRKVAAFAEIYGVRTAWHGPGDVSPIGHAANVALDLACYNFGVQEYSPFNERTQEVFRNCPVMKNGYLYANETPGWGIEIDEKAAAKYPYGSFEGEAAKSLNGGWGEVRKLDGTIIKQ
jgi:mannonate dehydratase